MSQKDVYTVQEMRDLLKQTSGLERAFDYHFVTLCDDMPSPEPHYAFHPERKWEFDRAWVDHKLAVELDGGAHGVPITCHNCGKHVRAVKKDGSVGKKIHYAGWHARPARYLSDIEKFNEAQRLGWIVLTFTNDDIVGDPFKTFNYIREVLEQRHVTTPMIEELTPTETAVLHHVAGGFVTADIASRLDMAPATVGSHVQNISQKLNVSTRAAAVARAAAWGLINYQDIPWAEDPVNFMND